ncbi:hypothetical protein HG1285_01993 [Hydrogenivirga sp. 128-5-R1-1]|nr:hypothetical protein HG1285_01993 [Hydrogenivirga sp. 128-5-R1-1]
MTFRDTGGPLFLRWVPSRRALVDPSEGGFPYSPLVGPNDDPWATHRAGGFFISSQRPASPLTS